MQLHYEKYVRHFVRIMFITVVRKACSEKKEAFSDIVRKNGTYNLSPEGKPGPVTGIRVTCGGQ